MTIPEWLSLVGGVMMALLPLRAAGQYFRAKYLHWRVAVRTRHSAGLSGQAQQTEELRINRLAGRVDDLLEFNFLAPGWIVMLSVLGLLLVLAARAGPLWTQEGAAQTLLLPSPMIYSTANG